MNVARPNAQLIAWTFYVGVPLAAALLFFLAATIGDYPLSERLGGAAWTFFLTLVIAMPSLSGYFARRAGG